MEERLIFYGTDDEAGPSPPRRGDNDVVQQLLALGGGGGGELNDRASVRVERGHLHGWLGGEVEAGLGNEVSESSVERVDKRQDDLRLLRSQHLRLGGLSTVVDWGRVQDAVFPPLLLHQDTQLGRLDGVGQEVLGNLGHVDEPTGEDSDLELEVYSRGQVGARNEWYGAS